jgi:hypothetical protein
MLKIFTLLTAIFIGSQSAWAQDMEPRSFSPAPVGMNFGVISVGRASGDLLFEQSTKLENVSGTITNVAAVYARTLSFFGASSKMVVVVPMIWGEWEGIYKGNFETASRTGIGDPFVEWSVNFIGAPAMKLSEMRNYQQRWVVGASVKVVVPVGQVIPEKLINLGANRWAVRPRLGVSRKVGRATLEAMTSVWLFQDNKEFLGDKRFEKDPLWALQFNGVYQWPSGFWVGVAGGFSRGGQTAVGDLKSDSYQKSTIWAAVVSAPISKRHSIKLLYVDGLSTRIGADLTNVSMAWAWRWGGEK